MAARPLSTGTNAFSKKVRLGFGTLLHALQFCRIHQALRVAPAMETGIADHVWTNEELVGKMEMRERREAA